MQRIMRAGLIVNPYAGIGGAVALKGSDGDNIVQQALSRGAVPQAQAKALRAIRTFYQQCAVPVEDVPLQWLTWGQGMGEDILRQAGCPDDTVTVLGQPNTPLSADDTRHAVRAMKKAGVDIVLFAGGDGTARDISDEVGTGMPVLGIPAGCKMHSAVYALNPEAAGYLLHRLLKGGLVQLSLADVRDIDEHAFREGVVKARYYNTMTVPSEDRLLQQVKCGGQDVEELVLTEMAAWVCDHMEQDVIYAIGSGTTVAAVMAQLGLENTLLGVDLVQNGACIASDVTSAQLLAAIEGQPAKAVITVIGGQGHVLGRGNQQFSPDVVRAIGKENFYILASRAKLNTLNGRPLAIDSGDPELDQHWCGLLPVITGYEDKVLYPAGLSTGVTDQDVAEN